MPPPGYDTQDTEPTKEDMGEDGTTITEREALDAVLCGDTDRARRLVAELSDTKLGSLDYALWQFGQVVSAERSERRNRETS